MIDEIRGEYFKGICDFSLGSEIPSASNLVMYADLQKYEEALSVIQQNSHIKFKLVTHNGDETVKQVELPDILVRWYTQNLNFKHPKVEPIPIGLENKHWHPHKDEILDNKPTFHSRVFKSFAQFNPFTHTEERITLLNLINGGQIAADIFRCVNGTDYDLFVSNLRSYAFCLCPRGNGIDTHRIWEALYMGCVPVVKNCAAHDFNYGHIDNMNKNKLPIIFIDDWLQLTNDFLERQYNRINMGAFNSEMLSMTYWKDKIKCWK